ncbi:hypothetical protein [Nocardia thailandica]
MDRKLFAAAAFCVVAAISSQGTASADTTDYDSLNGPWPSKGACEHAAARLNSNGKNPTTACYQISGRDGWYFRYAVVLD